MQIQTVVGSDAESDDYSGCFTSDDASYKVYDFVSDGAQDVKLSVHEHTWNYGVGTTASADDTLKAWCSEDFGAAGNCDCNTETNAQTSTIVAPTSLTYDGNAKEATVGGVAVGGTLGTETVSAITYQKKTGESTWESLESAPVAVGTYKASIKIGSGDGAKTACVVYAVVPKSTALAIDAIAAQTYTGNALEPDVVVRDASGNELAGDTDYTVAFEDNTQAGTATVKVTGVAGYETLSAQANFTVSKAKVAVPVAETGLVYSGEEQTGVALPQGAGYTLAGNVGTDAGSYTAVATLADTDNYEWDLAAPTSEDQSIAWEIARKQVTVTADDKSMKLGGEVPELTATVEGTLGADEVAYGFDSVEPKAQGAYTIAAKGEEDQGNYAVSYAAGTLVVSAPGADASADPADLKRVLAGYRADVQYAGKALDVVLRTNGEVPQADKDAISALAGAVRKVDYSPADLFLVATDASGTTERNIGSENDELISVTYAFDFAGKADVRVLRCHEGAAEELAETPNADGEYVRFDEAAGAVVVCAKRYSTFGIAYREAQVVRVWGADRYGTMAGAVEGAFLAAGGTGSAGGAVVLCTGDDYPDALSASGLAGLLGAPVVLTGGSALSAEAAAQIERLGAGTVYIVGGTAAVSEGVETEVRALCAGAAVERIAGADRYETSAAVYEAGKAIGAGWGATAVIATGGGYADALSASPYAWATGSPVLLVGGSALTDAVRGALEEAGFARILVAGGTAAVSDTVEAEVAGAAGAGTQVERVGGADRYATSVLWARLCVSEAGLSWDGLCVATGSNFADALAGGPCAAAQGAPVVLSDDCAAGRAALDATASAHASEIATARILGGTAALSQAVEDYLSALVLG